MSQTEIFISSLLLGFAVALGAWCGRDIYCRALDAIERDLGDKLRTLRITRTGLRMKLNVWAGAMVVGFIGLGLLLESIPFALLCTLFIAAAPWYLLRRLAEDRKARMEDQLADAMVTFSNGIKAGLSIAQSLDILAEQCPRPICDEFRQIVGEFNLGKPLERTLQEAKDRLRSENFSLFAAALLASRRSGGKLNETVDRIAHSVLELQRLERKVKSETAQARKSAVYMAIAPAVILVAYWFVDPVNTSLLFTTVPGQVLLALAVVLNVAAYFWARAILNPDL